jgi:phage portal protein BeeE
MLPPAAYNIAGREVSDAFVTVVRRAPFPGVPDYLAGILQIARRQFTTFLAADVAASRYWMAGGPITTVISTEQELTTDDADWIAQRWVDRRSLGADYPAVLGKGAEAKPWGADPTAESAVNARQEVNADVGRYFGVPTRILNAPAGDSETYSNVENDAVDLLRYCLRGYMGPVEDAISELLPGDYLLGRRMRLDATATVQGDLASRAAAYPALVTAGILTIAEARVRGFGLTPAPIADDLVPASDAAPSTVTATIR